MVVTKPAPFSLLSILPAMLVFYRGGGVAHALTSLRASVRHPALHRTTTMMTTLAAVSSAAVSPASSSPPPPPPPPPPARRRRAAVIGAGSAGLATGKVLRDAGLAVDIYERAPALGGIWRYDQPENTNRVLYKSLVTNLPKEVMQFEALPFDASLPSFVTSDDMLGYLRSYASAFGLESMVRFNRTVVAVRPVFDDDDDDDSDNDGAEVIPERAIIAVRRDPGEEDEQPRCWRLQHRRTNGKGGEEEADEGEEEEAFYDFVVVANGHYEKAHWPMDLCEGVRDFPRERLLHSRDYDTPEAFKGQTVVW